MLGIRRRVELFQFVVLLVLGTFSSGLLLRVHASLGRSVKRVVWATLLPQRLCSCCFNARQGDDCLQDARSCVREVVEEKSSIAAWTEKYRMPGSKRLLGDCSCMTPQ